MKLVKAYVRKLMIDQVVRALEEVGAPRMMATDVQAVGSEVDECDCCVNVDYGTTTSELVKLEVICKDEKTKKIVEAIRENARTGKKGDGLIVISPIEEILGIRSGEEKQD